MSLRHAILLPAVALALLASVAFAADMGSPGPNQLYGHITSNRALTYASPGPNYEIIGDLTVDPGVTLTVERGVTLIVTPYSDLTASGQYPGLVEIDVWGSLVVPAGPGPTTCRSTSAPTAKANYFPWGGIHVESGGAVSLPNVFLSGADVGLYLEAGASLASGDSLSPTPLTISRCNTGVRVNYASPLLEHLLIVNCVYGVSCPGGSPTLSYVSLVNNTHAVPSAFNTMYFYNVIMYSDTSAWRYGVETSAYVQFNYANVWGYASHDLRAGYGPAGLGTACASFDPFFGAGDSTYHLSPASLFTNYSVSGGQIGAYGPGPTGLPTPVVTASLVSAEAIDGVANVRWYVGQDGQKASIVRRVDGGDWAPLTVLLRDGTGFVTLQDASVTPGTRYGYAIGTQNNGQIGLDGEVWLTVQPHVTALSRPTISPNPAPDGWTVSFTAPGTQNAKLEILDVSGRLLSSRNLGALQIGQNSTFVPAGNLSPGIYWVRVRQEGHATMARAVKAR